MSNTEVNAILIDAHVHVYDCYDMDQLLDAAVENFNKAAKKLAIGNGFNAVLLLSETSRDNWFSKSSKTDKYSRWQIEKTPEASVVLAKPKGKNGSDTTIYIMAGRQIITAEGLELLALITDGIFDDDLPVATVLNTVREQDAIPVLPWAVGKWLGKRGKVLSNVINKEAGSDLCLGDNSGRPIFWRNPSHFKQAGALHMPLLPGSDPLPFASEVKRVGSFGFSLRGRLSASQPATDLKNLLRTDSAEFQAYGRLENPWQFFVNQIRVRMV